MNTTTKAIPAKPDPIAELTELVVEGFQKMGTRMDKGFQETDERFNKIETNFEKLDQSLVDVRTGISFIRHEIESLQDRIGDMAGYSKEIDAVTERLSLIENHLGLTQEIRT